MTCGFAVGLTGLELRPLDPQSRARASPPYGVVRFMQVRRLRRSPSSRPVQPRSDRVAVPVAVRLPRARVRPRVRTTTGLVAPPPPVAAGAEDLLAGRGPQISPRGHGLAGRGAQHRVALVPK